MALSPTHFPGTHAHASLIYTPRVPGLTTRVGTPTPTHRPCASVVRLSHQGPGVAAAGTKEAPPGFSPTSSARVWLALADLGSTLVPQTDSRCWRTQVMGDGHPGKEQPGPDREGGTTAALWRHLRPGLTRKLSARQARLPAWLFVCLFLLR